MLERAVRSFSAALCVLPVAYAALFFIAGPAFAQAAFLYGLGCTFVGAAAGRLLGRRHAALQIAASALPAAALAIALQHSLPVFARIAAAALGALLAVWAERRFLSAEGLHAAPLLMPLAFMLGAWATLWIAQAASGTSGGETWAVLLVTGCVWLVVAMFCLNRVSLLGAARAQKRGELPPGMRRGGLLGAAVFLAAAFALANAKTLLDFFSTAIRTLIAWIIHAMMFLSSLLPLDTGPMPSRAPGQSQLPPPPAGNGSKIGEIIRWIIFGLIALAILTAVVWKLSRLIPKLWRNLRERLARLFETWREEDAGYSDRSERLMTLRQAFAGAGARVRRLTRRFRRKPSLADFPTNAGKARFLFREFLRGLAIAGNTPPPRATATEIAQSAPPLAAAYNRARYAQEEPSDEQIAQAAQSVHKKG